MMLEPGEALFMNNCIMLHKRTGFEDHEDPQRKRAGLRRAIGERYALHDARGRAVMQRRAEQTERRLWTLARGLTADQRRTLKRKLLAYAADFEELAKQR